MNQKARYNSGQVVTLTQISGLSAEMSPEEHLNARGARHAAAISQFHHKCRSSL